MSEKLVVCDVDFDVCAQRIEKYWEAEDAVLSEIVSILNNVCRNGVALGEAHKALTIISDEVNNIYLKSSGRGGEVKGYVSKFLSKIDDIDLNLYGG